jgi:hypothetical protein
MSKCSCKDCDLEVFENSDKCILHCEKDDWYKHNNFNVKDEKIFINIFGCVNNWKFSSEKIDLFWNTFNKKLKENIEKNSLKFTLENINFPAMGVNKSYIEVELYKIKYLELKNCTFLDIVDISNLLTVQNFEVNHCKFKENVFFKEKIFNGQFFFQSNEVFKNIDFFNIEFNGTCSLSNNKFKNELTFNYVRFNDLVIFNNSEIEDLFFKNTFFRKETNFLDMTLSKVGSRETARIIKDSFEKQNNIIEANKFYALEMKEREKELSPKKDFFEWLVFKIHGISSNHSQDWTLALFWIFIVGFIASYYDFNLIQNSKAEYIHYNLSSIFKTIGLIFIILFIDRLCKIKDKFINISYFIISSYLIYIYATEDYLLSLFSQTINPFSVMKTNDPINGIQLFFKVIITYLIYQFIISIRQNTRRK